VNGTVVHTVAEGNGPVHALDAALRKALAPVYPALDAFRLADYKVPETLSWCDSPLPRNANGKLMKRLLREQIQVQN